VRIAANADNQPAFRFTPYTGMREDL